MRKEYQLSSIDFDALRCYTEIPPAAEALLDHPEREVSFDLNLKIGPNTILQANAYVVYANTVRGPAKGGIRMAADVTLAETRDLAERMVWKTALARIPFGGGKSGIALDPHTLSRFEKTAVLKEWVHMMQLDLRHGMYVPAPDMGTNATDMAVIFGELHLPECVTGKPPRIGGLPGRLEATGRGVSFCIQQTLAEILHLPVTGSRIAIQGFGNVGSYAARYLHAAGCRVIAVSDVTGGRYQPEGLDIPTLAAYVATNGSLEGAPGRVISNEELLLLEVDVLAPCARENQLTEENASVIKAHAIVEGANGPTTPDADAILLRRHIPLVPDFLANAGGVIASYVEWRQAKSGAMTEIQETFSIIENRLALGMQEMLSLSERHHIPLRMACQVAAAKELVASLRDRDWI